MKAILSGSRLGPVGASVTLHVGLLGFLVFSFSFGSAPVAPPAPQAIEAVVVDESLVQEEMLKLEQQEKQEEAEARRRREELLASQTIQ